MHLTIADMPIVPLFLFKLSVSLALVWLFYQAVLRRMTFYSLNRWYLLGYTLISFLIPFINIGPMIPEGAGEPAMLQFIPAIGGVAQLPGTSVSSIPATGPSGWTVFLWVVAAGAVLMMARVAVQWISLVRLRRRAKMIGGMAIKIYQVDLPIRPFSFGRAVFINQSMHSEKEWADIILHEYVHIRQRHTVDILIAELVCVLNWYNPFAWLIRYSIRQNLEFIADQGVLDKGIDRKGYQYHLLKVVGEPDYRLANNFNFSSLRKRIVMMNRVRSARVHLLKILFIVPLVTLLLVAFREKGGKLFGAHGAVYVNAAGIAITSGDRKPLEGVLVRDRTTGLETTTDGNGFYKMQIPVTGKSVKVHLDYMKPGYDTDFRTRSIPKLEETIGILDVAVMYRLDRKRPTADPLFIVPSFRKDPVDPAYADAEQELHRVLQESDHLNRYMKLQKDHPEIGLFYETEDRRKEIVIYLDGTIERYGYPGTPGLPELYKKYGEIPGFMATDQTEGHQVNTGYLARWAAIGEQAQREFHPTGPNVRTVIFPGDSRVIGVPLTGKPKVYDMDNDAAVERTEFERIYGKLPDCVPKAGNNTDGKGILDINEAAKLGGVKVRKDTVPGGAVNAVPGAANHASGGKANSGPDSLAKKRLGKVIFMGGLDHQPLIIINGRAVPNDTLQDINPDSIASIDVYKDTGAIHSILLQKYGDRANNGVIVVHMKNEKPPLCLVDGREVKWDSLKAMNQDEFASMTVLKDKAALAQYGEKGKNGVIIITLKKKSSLIARPHGPDCILVTTDDGSFSLVANSIKVGNWDLGLDL